MEKSKNLRGRVLLAAQHISLAKVLAANDKAVRDKGVKRLGKWITARSECSEDFTQQDLMTIWKGLFYCMWMADKPLYQEELAEQISRLIHSFKKLEKGLLYAECFFLTMRQEWFGIDQYRLDKFMMLIRRCIRQMFTYCSSHSWSADACEGITGVLERGVTTSAESTPSMGYLLHVADVILEELAKAEGSEKALQAVLRPFASLIADSTDDRIREHVSERIFHHLIRQSPLGIEFQEKFEAWKQAGFPGNSWREMELVEVSDEEQSNDEPDEGEGPASVDAEKHLDPRAGRIDVELPTLDFDAAEVAELLKSQLLKASSIKQRKALNMLATQFLELSNGKYPLGFKKPEGSTRERNHTNHQEELWKAAEDLIEYEEELLEEDDNVENITELKPGKKRKSQNDVGKVVPSKRRKGERSDPAVTEKCNGETDAHQSNTYSLKKPPKNILNNKNKKNRTVLQSENSNQELKKKMFDKIDNSILEPQARERVMVPQESVEVNANVNNEGGDVLPKQVMKRKRKSKKNAKVGVAAQSVVKDNSAVVGTVSVVNNTRKQKGDSKSTAVLQNDENILLQSNTEISSLSPNRRKISKLQTAIVGAGEQILHEYSSRRNSDSPGKKKTNGFPHKSTNICDLGTKQIFGNSAPVSVRKMSLRRLTMVQCPSRVTPKKRNSLSNWKVTVISHDCVGEEISKTEGLETSSTAPSVLQGKASESMGNFMKTPKPNKCSTVEISVNTPEAVNKSVENPKSAKKVNIVLNKNIAFEARDYPKAVKQSPNIPFDANKKPVQGVLKPGLLPSPINPFYRKSKRLKL